MLSGFKLALQRWHIDRTCHFEALDLTVKLGEGRELRVEILPAALQTFARLVELVAQLLRVALRRGEGL